MGKDWQSLAKIEENPLALMKLKGIVRENFQEHPQARLRAVFFLDFYGVSKYFWALALFSCSTHREAFSMNVQPENVSLANTGDREKLQYSYTKIEPLAMADLNLVTALKKEFPSLEWLSSILFNFFKLLLNNSQQSKEENATQNNELILQRIQE